MKTTSSSRDIPKNSLKECRIIFYKNKLYRNDFKLYRREPLWCIVRREGGKKGGFGRFLVILSV